jgi:hypothetical protein
MPYTAPELGRLGARLASPERAKLFAPVYIARFEGG